MVGAMSTAAALSTATATSGSEPLAGPSGMAREDPADNPIVDIVVPVYNEEHDLASSVRRLRAHLDERFPFAARITIADNASTDATALIGQRLAAELEEVSYLRLDERGRGRALSAAWMGSAAEVVAYMDVDLSTDLDALLPLVSPLLTGESDIAIGSRLAPGARVHRGLKREVISRLYNRLLRVSLGIRVRDAQCGFKAVHADVARRLLPRVENRNWFFDTELLALAQRDGCRITELPVAWRDDPDSRVRIVATALEDLSGILRLLRGSGPHRFLRFAGVGIISTLAYAGLYALLRSAVSMPVANLLALLVTAVANTAANRSLTFGIRGRSGLWADHAAGLIAFGVALLITELAAWFLKRRRRGQPAWRS